MPRPCVTRDVNNLTTYFGQFDPTLLTTQYAEEIWSLYEHGELNPDVKLTGRFESTLPPVDLEASCGRSTTRVRPEAGKIVLRCRN